MPYGLITPAMQREIANQVDGHIVYDLGAGDGYYSELLLESGAATVVAVEKEDRAQVFKIRRPDLKFVHAYFREVQVPTGIDVAFLAWPQNAPLNGIVDLLGKSHTIIYLGQNSEKRGSACGNRSLYNYLRTREVLVEIQNEQNDFIVYGPGYTVRPLLREEAEALAQ
jgi:hypothetical protein